MDIKLVRRVRFMVCNAREILVIEEQCRTAKAAIYCVSKSHINGTTGER